MQALYMTEYGTLADVVDLLDIAKPRAPATGEALAAVECAPINNSDVTDLAIGDRVLIPRTYYVWRERLLLPAADLFALPAVADPRQLSMLSINPPTAALMLSESVDVRPGDWVIQNAGNSGVGRSVIAIAKQRGLRTVSIVRRHELVDELCAAGSEVVLVDGPDLLYARTLRSQPRTKVLQQRRRTV